MRVQTHQREEWTVTTGMGRVLVTAGRFIGGKRITLDTERGALDAPSARALAAWLLVQANDMDAEAAHREAARKAKNEGDVPLD